MRNRRTYVLNNLHITRNKIKCFAATGKESNIKIKFVDTTLLHI